MRDLNPERPWASLEGQSQIPFLVPIGGSNYEFFSSFQSQNSFLLFYWILFFSKPKQFPLILLDSSLLKAKTVSSYFIGFFSFQSQNKFLLFYWTPLFSKPKQFPLVLRLDPKFFSKLQGLRLFEEGGGLAQSHLPSIRDEYEFQEFRFRVAHSRLLLRRYLRARA